MSGDCDVCGQYGHVEFEHCSFKEEYEELKRERDEIALALSNEIKTLERENEELGLENDAIKKENGRLEKIEHAALMYLKYGEPELADDLDAHTAKARRDVAHKEE